MDTQSPVNLRDLYPAFSDQELEEAEANLRRYLAVLIRMAERFASEGRSINDLANLTNSQETYRMLDERSSPSNP